MAPSPQPSRYIEPAEVGEVLLEQLEYLVIHKAACGKDQYTCTDCWRLNRAKEVLLIPFETKKFHMKQKKKSA